jgi:hypothetical protein
MEVLDFTNSSLSGFSKTGPEGAGSVVNYQLS